MSVNRYEQRLGVGAVEVHLGGPGQVLVVEPSVILHVIINLLMPNVSHLTLQILVEYDDKASV